MQYIQQFYCVVLHRCDFKHIHLSRISFALFHTFLPYPALSSTHFPFLFHSLSRFLLMPFFSPLPIFCSTLSFLSVDFSLLLSLSPHFSPILLSVLILFLASFFPLFPSISSSFFCYNYILLLFQGFCNKKEDYFSITFSLNLNSRYISTVC